MSLSQRPGLLVATAIFSFAIALPRPATATIVEYQTILGSFQVNLYDNATPLTVANFLNYVQNGDYTDSIFHRSVPGFVIQGGGFNTDVNAQVNAIPANAPVTNEPIYSNVSGTIAMAKVSGNPNSATNQWYFNLVNNAAGLDPDNGGFTVFGEVTGNGMQVIDALAALPTFGFAGALSQLPLQNYSATDFSNQVPVDNTNLAIITSITVIDTTVDSAGAAGLNPPLSTADNSTPPVDGGGGGGGSLSLFALLALLTIFARRSVSIGSPKYNFE